MPGKTQRVAGAGAAAPPKKEASVTVAEARARQLDISVANLEGELKGLCEVLTSIYGEGFPEFCVAAVAGGKEPIMATMNRLSDIEDRVNSSASWIQAIKTEV